jgi:hypothetical protein
MSANLIDAHLTGPERRRSEKRPQSNLTESCFGVRCADLRFEFKFECALLSKGDSVGGNIDC